MTVTELHGSEMSVLRALGRAAGTVYLADLAFRRLLCALGGDAEVVDISAAIAAEHVRDLWNGRGPRSVRREVCCLRSAWSRAALSPNPWRAVSAIRVDPVELRIVTADEERALYSGADPVLALWLAVALETGARPGEICALRPRDVLRDAGAVVIESRAGARTKMRASRMCAVSGDTLARLVVRGMFGRELWGPGCGAAVLNRVRDRLYSLCDRVGVPRVRPQDLRRTVGTRLALAGVNAGIAARVLGHSDVSTTLRFYTRVQDADAAAAVARTWVSAAS